MLLLQYVGNSLPSFSNLSSSAFLSSQSWSTPLAVITLLRSSTLNVLISTWKMIALDIRTCSSINRGCFPLSSVWKNSLFLLSACKKQIIRADSTTVAVRFGDKSVLPKSAFCSFRCLELVYLHHVERVDLFNDYLGHSVFCLNLTVYFPIVNHDDLDFSCIVRIDNASVNGYAFLAC